MLKTIGILGGMGPLATVTLFENIVLNTDASRDQDHIPILIDNNTKITDRTDYILGKIDISPEEELVKSAQKLETMGADFLIMPCNTAHYFYDKLVDKVNIPFLNMIDETAKFIIRENPGIKKVGLLATEGTVKAEIYDKIFEKHNVDLVKPSEEKQKYITDLIYNIKKGIRIENLGDFYSSMEELSNQGVDIFIAGCTEISVAIELYDLKGKIVDPMMVLALEAIDYAGARIREI